MEQKITFDLTEVDKNALRKLSESQGMRLATFCRVHLLHILKQSEAQPIQG
jgi:hypothetical protein